MPFDLYPSEPAQRVGHHQAPQSASSRDTRNQRYTDPAVAACEICVPRFVARGDASIARVRPPLDCSSTLWRLPCSSPHPRPPPQVGRGNEVPSPTRGRDLGCLPHRWGGELRCALPPEGGGNNHTDEGGEKPT